ncbi:MAG: hypothetical protein Q4B91_02940 [Atopobiaceae bacterium]|nr:hypothetical protein [Atopobiaceae bacterium]
MADKTNTTGAAPERTVLSLSITVDDKRTLKIMAAERGVTIASIIHGWIEEHAGEEMWQREGGSE